MKTQHTEAKQDHAAARRACQEVVNISRGLVKIGCELQESPPKDWKSFLRGTLHNVSPYATFPSIRKSLVEKIIFNPLTIMMN